MKFLDEDQRWKLLQKKVFEKESCPLQLVEIGKKIARKCRGLSLTIMVVAGLLHSLGNMIKEDMWESVLENISSTESTIAQHCSKILCLSYDRLPLRLKPCFLYFAAFPEDSKIDVSKLVKLCGEEYLDDLVNRSLILVNKKEPDGKLITVGIHDLLREICLKKAEEQRLAEFLRCNPKLVNLRYIAFALNKESSPYGFPTSISKLPNLETIIACVSNLAWSHLLPVPYEIWGMPKLGHLIMGRRHFRLSYPSNIGISEESDLRTLDTVVDFRFTGEVLQILVNLRKLKVLFAEKEHFPSLESLILWEVYSIDEIPCGIGEIDSLQLIELFNSKDSLINSAKRIQEQQHENGNDAFQVLVHDSNDNKSDFGYEFVVNKHTNWEEYRLPA
ncbi:toMV susceptible protein tm-2-like [Primulina tabacum]|uniref:toMV susceptible protein tm-2-like n=1 Tax=Primulina tabacum TaxID=48773 RepID=UPI003F59A8AB